MGLQSQSTRPGQSRKYMTSRRKGRKGPWVALFVVAVAVIGGYLYFNRGGEPTAGASGDDATAQPTANAGSNAGTGETRPTRRPSNDRRHTSTPSNDRNGGDNHSTTDRNPREQTTFDLPDAGNDDRPITGEAREQYENGMRLIEEGRVVEGRAILSELLFRPPGSLPRHEAQAIRQRLMHLNESLVFSTSFAPNDPIAAQHVVRSGEILSRDIAPAFKTPYQFIMRINGITDASRVPAGATLKCIRGPVHARIVKSEYRMDLYVEDPDGLRIYLWSYPVGLGEFDSTPAGLWRIKPRSKVVNPGWTNPRTHETFDRDDPDIPIGEYWMALEGMDDNTREHTGYGIHGTNEQDSIGRQESMGCVRMRDQHIEEVFYMLSSGDSKVEILP